MQKSAYARRGMVVAPHHLAAQAGLAVLRSGGDAIEAMIATSATLAVVAPHLGGLGGDAYWLISEPGKPPMAIEAAGAAGRAVSPDLYRKHHLGEIPARGPLAANTVAGMVSGWSSALAISRGWGGRLPLRRLLEEAIGHASDGVPMSAGLVQALADTAKDLSAHPGFKRIFLTSGHQPQPGTVLIQAALAKTLERLAAAGPDDFYRGELAKIITSELKTSGSPITAADLAEHWARLVEPLSVRLSDATLYNLPPPTQGLTALMILGIFDRLAVTEGDSAFHIHALIEAGKHACRVRDLYVTDPFYMWAEAKDFLLPELLDEVAAVIGPDQTQPWTDAGGHGTSAWLGAIDAAGRTVSYMHSLHWSFGSGLALEGSGVVWHNRGMSFSLNPSAVNHLISGRKPYHTLSPALAVFNDGRVMAFGGMSGENQPQSQAALYSRYARFGQSLQQAVSAPRWYLGRRHGTGTATLKLENRVSPQIAETLRQSGHTLELVEPFSPLMGDAGAVVHRPSGTLEGASDPRSDGSVAAW